MATNAEPTMDEMLDESGSQSATETQAEPDAVGSTGETPAEAAPEVQDPQPEQPPKEDPVLARFTSCRWHATQDNSGADYCSHRDVLPYAGMNGFNPEAWCPDCEFFKVRRTVKKRNPFEIDDY